MAVKLKDYKNELNAKSLEELQSELVAAKKELRLFVRTLPEFRQ